MTRPTDALLHDFSPVDPQLRQTLTEPAAQLALRLLAVLLLAGYGAWLGEGVLLDNLGMIAVPLGYALLQAGVALPELAGRQFRLASTLVLLLDLMLLGTVLLNDPLPAVPTLIMLPLCLLLAGLRLDLPALLRSLALLLLVAGGALTARLLVAPELGSPSLLLQGGLVTLTVVGMVVVLARLDRHRSDALWRPDSDPVTGLANRASLYAAADFLFPLLHRQQAPMSLLYVVLETDADQAMRDRLVADFARQARGRLRGSDVLVRYGALEFVFLLPECPPDQADPIARQLQAAFQHSIRSQGMQAVAHIGATWLPIRPVALDQLLIDLDAAMARARQLRLAVAGAVRADAGPALGI